ncbi:MAG: single-stranded DNA-binding protein [Candidatus Cloacimonetes bacterium]|nr:single-stranded DNA-binding protein [Candidatus Cloacimonadota bacterium]MDY0367074.1 single-stranded DNA-binding protein [Candidatus Syntrophosphaera sp.]
MADLKVPRLNRVLIAGRITKELELKYTPKGSPVVNFSVAMDKRFKDESDQWQSVPVYVDVVAWNQTAENLCKQAHKGTAVLVEGKIDVRSYVDQNNVNRKVFEIIADFVQTLEWKPREEGGDTPPPHEEPPHAGSDATNDDVPF